MILSYNNNWLGYGQYVLGTDIVPIPAYSVRFQFASPQTAESLAGCGSRGTWTRLSDTVWDYTYENPLGYTSWYHEFDALVAPGGARRSEVLPQCEIVGSNLTGVTSIESAFVGQTNITAVHLYELSLVATNTFGGCTGMTSYRIDVCNAVIGGQRLGIPIDNNIVDFEIGTYNPAYITDQMILPNCSSFRIKSMPNLTEFGSQSFASIGSSQQHASIYIGSAPLVTTLYQAFMSTEHVESINIGSTGVLTGAAEAFYTSAIRQVPSNLDFSNCTNVRYMFAYAQNLTTIPDLDLTSAENAGYMCYNCTGLTKVPQFVFSENIRTGSNINSLFSACPNLTDGAYLFYVRMTGDISHWRDVYGSTPWPEGPYPLEGYADVNHVFVSSYSTEPGWQYIPSKWKE